MADDFLGSLGPINTYNSGIYFIAFIGTPSSTGEWILQLGGHHYALNFYYHGSVESPTPYFTGMSPRLCGICGPRRWRGRWMSLGRHAAARNTSVGGNYGASFA